MHETRSRQTDTLESEKLLGKLGARVCARRRDVSLHSRNARGAHAMDVFTTIVQTCKKLGLSSYEFFRMRLGFEKSALDIPQMIGRTADAGDQPLSFPRSDEDHVRDDHHETESGHAERQSYASVHQYRHGQCKRPRQSRPD